jgi:DNA-binding LytR/AlgR family response regulator
MQFTQRRRFTRSGWSPFAAAMPLGLLVGFLRPFGSYPAYPTATRYAFWLGLTAAGVTAAVTADAAPPIRRLRAGPIRIGVVALASALPMTFVVAWTMSPLQPGRVFTPQQLPALFAAVAAVQLLVVYATMIVAPATDDARRIAGSPPGSEPAVEAAPAVFPSALLNKLPPEIGCDIVALETEDHYLRVHAAEGSALVLMRMADAVASVDPRLGAQVHRRWWIAEAATAGVQADGQKLSVRLSDGRLVPIGRTFAAAARARFGDGREKGQRGRAAMADAGQRSAEHSHA